MRKSSLRFLCGTSFLLIVSVCLLVPQIRTRLVPMLTRLTIDPGLSIGDIRLHAGGSIVEMKQLNWQSTDQDRTLALSAKEVWLALDTQPLLERRMIFPRAFLNEANLDLRDNAHGAGRPTNNLGTEAGGSRGGAGLA